MKNIHITTHGEAMIITISLGKEDLIDKAKASQSGLNMVIAGTEGNVDISEMTGITGLKLGLNLYIPSKNAKIIKTQRKLDALKAEAGILPDVVKQAELIAQAQMDHQETKV